MKKIITILSLMAFLLNPLCCVGKDLIASSNVKKGNYNYYVDNNFGYLNENNQPQNQFDEDSYNIQSQASSDTFQPTLNGRVVKTGRGKKLNIFLQNEIQTNSMQVGDEIIGVLNEDWYYNGSPVATSGSVLYGKLENAHSAGRLRQNAKFQINFYKMATPDGMVYDISAEKVDFEVTPSTETKSELFVNAVKYVAIGALVGLLLFSGSSSSFSGHDRHYGRGAAIGAGVAAAGTAITTLSAKGEDAVIPANTLLEITLTDDITVPLAN